MPKQFQPLVRVCVLATATMIAGPSLATEPTWSDGSPIAATRPAGESASVHVHWKDQPPRRWAGPMIWTNRLQDWQVRGGALVCEPAQRNTPCRTAHVLTCQLEDKPGPFRIESVVRVPRTAAGRASATRPATARSGREDITAPPVPGLEGAAREPFVGFLVGAGEGYLDYRAAALVHHFAGRGGGLLAVCEPASGQLIFRDMGSETAPPFPALDGQTTVVAGRPVQDGMLLRLEGVPRRDGAYDLRLTAWSPDGKELLAGQELPGVPGGKLLGNIALAANAGAVRASFAFESVTLAGPRLAHHPARRFGPIAGTLYSVSDNTLKLGVQFMHLGEALLDNDPEATEARRLRVRLEIRPRASDGLAESRVVGPQAISSPDYYVLFRVEGLDTRRDWLARAIFEDADGKQYAYDTTIRREPTDQDVLTAAGFTGMGVMGRTAYQVGPPPQEGEVLVGRWTPANVWMPFADSVRAMRSHKPDILFFTGDQIYDGKPSPRDDSRMPVEDYLYKWLLWHWSFRELTSHTPATCQTDDHDVFHGNIWGWSGRLNLTGNNRDGGYLFSPYFVNFVQRTQAGHNPDAFDPGPTNSGILNYYSTFTWGGVGFAVLEDRKFKTPPDVEESEQQELLGPGQLRMLRQWSQDWKGHQVKVVVSQTIYASMHVSDAGQITRDFDSNGFPKADRDEAVRLFRQCRAFLLCGDQHLGTFARLGIDRPSDGVYQFCVPAIGNIFWRWFYPADAGRDRGPGEPAHLGEFVDPFGNPFRMIAVANPERQALLRQKLRQRYLIPEAEAEAGKGHILRTSQGDGYGVVRIDKKARTITAECWPYNADPAKGDKPFAGWPITVSWDDLAGEQPG